jgi:predicted metal-dependent hydrolase
MRHLLAWHAVEELEHEAVAFDVLRHVAPSYPLRMLGFAVATIALGGFWLASSRALLAVDGIPAWEALRALRRGSENAPLLDGRAVVRGMLAYLKPRFHPSDADSRHRPLVERTLAALRAEGALA